MSADANARKVSRVVPLMAVPPEIFASKVAICRMPTSRPLPTGRKLTWPLSPPRSATVKPANMSSETLMVVEPFDVPPRVLIHTASNRSGWP
jgi:hypothetical protein